MAKASFAKDFAIAKNVLAFPVGVNAFVRIQFCPPPELFPLLEFGWDGGGVGVGGGAVGLTFGCELGCETLPFWTFRVLPSVSGFLVVICFS